MVAYFFNHLNLGPNKSIAIDFRVPLVTGVIRCKINEGKINDLSLFSIEFAYMSRIGLRFRFQVSDPFGI